MSVGPCGRRARRRATAVAVATLVAMAPGCARVPRPATPAVPSAAAADSAARARFAELVARLSEPGGDFNSDNLVSNETSYLHVVGALRALGVRGGAYVGVGPDQSFSYIAHVRPEVAFIIDIRRDNLLQHLMFKALFARARNRAEYLALLVGRPAPADVDRWGDRPIEQIVAYLDSTPTTPASAAAAQAAVADGVRRSGVPVTAAEMDVVARVHAEFVGNGLGIQYTSRGRIGRPNYPTYRRLILERDLDERQEGYLAREELFQFVKALEARDRVVPVVGNLAGDHALAAVGREIAARGLTVSAFYTSNVEQYLMRDGSFPRFAQTVASLPRDARSVMIRSFFGGFGAMLPQSMPGHFSTQVLQTVDAFAGEVARDGFRTYYDVVTKGAVDLRQPAPPR